MARGRPDQSQELGTPSYSPKWVAKVQVLEPLCSFPGYALARSWIGRRDGTESQVLHYGMQANQAWLKSPSHKTHCSLHHFNWFLFMFSGPFICCWNPLMSISIPVIILFSCRIWFPFIMFANSLSSSILLIPWVLCSYVPLAFRVYLGQLTYKVFA